MKKTVIDIRAESKKALAEWFDEKVVQPFVARGRELGLSDDEINIALNVAIQPAMAWNERPYIQKENHHVTKDACRN